MQKSIVSQNMANPSIFPLPNRVQYLPVFIYSPENFLTSNFIKPTDLFHSSPNPHFKGFFETWKWKRMEKISWLDYVTPYLISRVRFRSVG